MTPQRLVLTMMLVLTEKYLPSTSEPPTIHFLLPSPYLLPSLFKKFLSPSIIPKSRKQLLTIVCYYLSVGQLSISMFVSIMPYRDLLSMKIFRFFFLIFFLTLKKIINKHRKQQIEPCEDKGMTVSNKPFRFYTLPLPKPLHQRILVHPLFHLKFICHKFSIIKKFTKQNCNTKKTKTL